MNPPIWVNGGFHHVGQEQQSAAQSETEAFGSREDEESVQVERIMLLVDSHDHYRPPPFTAIRLPS